MYFCPDGDVILTVEPAEGESAPPRDRWHFRRIGPDRPTSERVARRLHYFGSDSVETSFPAHAYTLERPQTMLQLQRQQQQARFVGSFVDSVTIRPFFDDLKRIKRNRQMFGELPTEVAAVQVARAA